MPKVSDTNEVWKRTGQMLRAKVSPNRKKFIDEMDLEECLEAQKKYLVWIKKYKYDQLDQSLPNWYSQIENKDHSMVIYQYITYLLPRIEFLQTSQSVKDILI